jgi:hypothetical protein
LCTQPVQNARGKTGGDSGWNSKGGSQAAGHGSASLVGDDSGPSSHRAPAGMDWAPGCGGRQHTFPTHGRPGLWGSAAAGQREEHPAATATCASGHTSGLPSQSEAERRQSWVTMVKESMARNTGTEPAAVTSGVVQPCMHGSGLWHLSPSALAACEASIPHGWVDVRGWVVLPSPCLSEGHVVGPVMCCCWQLVSRCEPLRARGSGLHCCAGCGGLPCAMTRRAL